MSNALSRIAIDASAPDSSLAVRDSCGRLTYSQLRAEVRELAGRLSERGIRPGVAVLLATENRLIDVVGLLAILQAGALVVPLRDPDAATAIASYAERTAATAMVRNAEIIELAGTRPETPPEFEGAAFVLFTSGSTDTPKGVVLGADEFSAKLDAIASVIPFSPPRRTLVALHLSFAFGIWVTLLTLQHGGTVELAPLTVRDIVAALQEREVERIALVPTIVRAMFAKRTSNDDDSILDRFSHARAVRDVLTGGEVLGPRSRSQMESFFSGAGIYDVFGLTETSTSDFILPPNAPADALGTVGYPTPGVCFRITTGDGSIIADGDAGELEIDTPFLMRGYLGRADLTADASRDGYFRTGDVARVRKGGALEILGRSKDIIVRGGIKISPVELERSISAHPGVAAALALGLPDDVLGERSCIAVVAHDGSTIEEGQLRAFLSGRSERQLVPDEIVVVPELPLGPTGKANRTALRALLLGQRAAQNFAER